jgi:tetratricopeptide (TPR) repeat protein
MAELAGKLRQPSQEWLVAVYRPLLALLEGRLDEAEVLISEARELGEHAQRWNAAVSHGLQLFLLRRLQGRLAEVEELVRRSASDHPTYPIWRCALAFLLAETGKGGESREAFGALAADDFAAVPVDEEWLVCACLMAETACTLAAAGPAARLYERLAPYADRIAISYPEICVGSVSRYLGLLAATCSRPKDAARHFENAIAANEQIGAHPWTALTREDYGRLLAVG